MSRKKDNKTNNLKLQVGQTINRLRQAYNMSLADLSGRSGVAKSIIYQIEKNETNPTLNTMLKLSKALDRSLGDILEDGGNIDNPFIEKLTKSDTPILISEDGLCELRICGWIKAVEIIQYYHFTAKIGGVLISEGHPKGSIENLTILQGIVKVTVAGVDRILNQGETLRYHCDCEHTITNIGKNQVIASMINFLPTATRLII